VAQVYLLSTEEGGRRTGLTTGYRPQFYFRTTDVVGNVELHDTAVALPGDSVAMTVSLGKPIAMTEGLGFAIREGNRTVGAGSVHELLD
jgi:elongation factor Tu